MTTGHRWCVAGAGALMAAVVLSGCGSDATPAQQGTASTSPSSAPASASAAVPPPAPAPPPLSDEDQIRQAVIAFAEAYNTQNWAAYNELMCQKMAEQFNGPAMDSLKQTRINNGLTQVIGVDDIAIDGVNATAKMDAQNEVLGRQKIPMKLAQDQDGWKVCMPA
jgi:hypothetical protein